MTLTGGDLMLTGSATTTVTGPTNVNIGVPLSAGEEGVIEVHVWSSNDLTTGASYVRLRQLLVNGNVHGSLQKTVVHQANGLDVSLNVDTGADEIRLALTSIASSVNWFWWVSVDIKNP